MGLDGGFITGSDFLMDGGVTAARWYGDVGEVRPQQLRRTVIIGRRHPRVARMGERGLAGG